MCLTGEGTVNTSLLIWVFLPLELLANNFVVAAFKDSQRDFGHCFSCSSSCYFLCFCQLKHKHLIIIKKIRAFEILFPAICRQCCANKIMKIKEKNLESVDMQIEQKANAFKVLPHTLVSSEASGHLPMNCSRAPTLSFRLKHFVTIMILISILQKNKLKFGALW